MNEKVITDNASEKITVKWDETRFTLVMQRNDINYRQTITLNPKEMLDLIEFAGKLGGE